MIADSQQYKKADEELRQLQDWLDRLIRENPAPEKGLTKAGIRKMIARIHEEMAAFEAGQELEALKPTKS